MFEDGDTLGPYTIVRRLGAGAMGEVYQARHRHMGRDVAIKLLRAELTEESDVVARFFTEARATAAVRHPGIVEIFDCDLHRSGRAFIVMEYLAGEDLARRLEAGSFALDYAGLRAIGRQLASALAAAHALGIVHRDLKPGNIFLVGQGAPSVKIVDFGIAKLLHRDGRSHSQTQTGHILGTPLYMSPEQARGAKTIDHRTDIYALGCVLFEMIAGQPPFVRKGAAQVIVAHLHDPVPHASSLEPSVPAALDELVARMMAKDPSQRPQTMTDVLAQLAEPAAAAPGHVATQLLPGGKSGGGSGPVVATPLKAAGSGPAAAAPSTPLAGPPLAPAIARPPVAAPTRAGFAGRDAQILARAGSTTLGNSASELVAATEHVARARPPARARGALIAAATAFGVGLVVVIALRSGTRSGAASSSAAASVAAPSAPPTAPSAEAPVAAPPTTPPAAVVAPPSASVAPTNATLSTTPASSASRPARHHHEHAKSSGEFKAIED
jgi:tRNA A-37 threonylcarbamoyl transferase component Bud32